MSKADERLTLEGTRVTVNVPKGWTRAPASSDTPILMLWLCDSSQSNGCLVRATLTLTQLSTAQAPRSLAAQLASWRKMSASEVVEAPHKFDIAGHPAVESVARGQVIFDFAQPNENGNSAAESKVIDAVTVVEDGGTFYRCSLSTTRAQFTDEIRRSYQAFCRSLIFDGTNASG